MPKDLLIAARKNRVITCEELNFVWDKHELDYLAELWTEGMSAEWLAKHFERDPDEIIIALIHLARQDKITARKRGLKGD